MDMLELSKFVEVVECVGMIFSLASSLFELKEFLPH